MNRLAFALYLLAAFADVIALLLALGHLPGRLRSLSAVLPAEPTMPLSYNESLTAVEAMLAARSAAMVDAQVRAGFNELIDALKAEVTVREASDRRLAALMDPPSDTRSVLLSSVLLMTGVVLGAAGNLVGSSSGG